MDMNSIDIKKKAKYFRGTTTAIGGEVAEEDTHYDNR